MIHLESGPAKTDFYWWVGRLVVVGGFALYFVYDGAIGWPMHNRAEAIKRLPSLIDPSVTIEKLGKRPTEDEFKALEQEIREASPTKGEVRFDEFQRRLGSPVFTKPGTTAESKVHFFASLDGYAAAEFDARGVLKPNTLVSWVRWYKPQQEIFEQFYWAAPLLLVSAWLAYKSYRAGTLRAVADDQGILYDGKRIAWDAIQSLKDYSPKGWIDMYYLEGANEKRLRWDNEKVLRFEEMVDVICRVKGIENPIAASKAAERSDDDDDADETESK